MRRQVQAHALAVLVIAAGAGAAQGQIDVDLALVLAVDISHSMDHREQQLQRDGYVAAFLDADVRRVIRQGPHGRIAVTYLEWSGADTQHVVLPWTLIDGPAAADLVARRLAAHPISRGHTTSISAALAFSARQLKDSPYRAARRVIDISGDGINNAGPPVDLVRDGIVGDGIVINGLPILDSNAHAAEDPELPGLDTYYSHCVIGGAGSFVVPIRSETDFAAATKQKLLLEIAGLMGAARVIRAQNQSPARVFDCRRGGWQRQRPESRWHRWCVAIGICEPR
ncbi:MAG TPA: DUF1194 domain-containing protein [Hyphomicrobiaceae bacterium]|nr:DUF1194 domain-containing protein [Hyphomicrobiaceae bacterium]